jgi:hypothetical protein
VVAPGLTGREVFARLAEPAGFRPGDVVTVRVHEAPMDRVARLPARAVDSSGTVLVVGEDDRLVERGVEVIRQQGDTVIARVGDLAGAEIVKLRSPMLGAGIKVRILHESGAATAHPASAQDEPMISLTPERRAQLIAFVQSDGAMAEADRSRVLAILANDLVPAGIVQSLEQNMGG